MLVGLGGALNPQSQLSLPLGSVQYCVESQYPMLYIRMDSAVKIRLRILFGRVKRKLKEARYRHVLWDLLGRGQVWC